MFIVFILTLFSVPVFSISYTVCASGCNHTLIQDAIYSATSGDTILVKDGNYIENVKVNKSVNLMSENGANNTIVIANNSNDHVFEVTADYVNLSGFSVIGTYSYTAGLYLKNANHCNISYNNVSNNGLGIYLSSSSNNTLKHNTISNSTRFNLYVFGTSMYHYNNDIDTSNTVEGKPVYYYFNKTNLILDNMDTKHITLAGCSNVTIKNFNVSKSDPIYLSHTTNSRIENNTVSSNYFGILLDSSSNNTLTNNTANSNGMGIYLYSSPNNTLTNNTANSNRMGIYLSNSSNNILRSNNANSNSQYGIFLYFSSSNTLTGNNANSNSQYGIIVYHSSKNTLTNNKVCSNTLSDFYIISAPDNFGDDNTCNNHHSWNDDETTGCTYACGELPISTCSDGIKNGNETDIDCGGSCPSCEDGKSCLQNSDCSSNTCYNSVCIQNETENWLSGWNYRKKLTINHTKINSDLTDFPILVKLTSTNFDFFKAFSTGNDIRFTRSDGTSLLKYERERHDVLVQKAEYWVNIPHISSTDNTEFYMYYGNFLATDGADPTTVWNDFEAVWHMEESNGNLLDSTSNNHDTTSSGGTPEYQVECKIGRCIDFEKDSGEYFQLEEGAAWSHLNGSQDFAFETWLNLESISSNWWDSKILGFCDDWDWAFAIGSYNDGNPFICGWDAGGGGGRFASGTTVFSLETWYHVIATYDADEGMAIYVDGNTTPEGTNSWHGTPKSDNINNRIGSWHSEQYFDGKLDEIRIWNKRPSTAEIKASYHSGSDSLLSYGTEDLVPTCTIPTDGMTITSDTMFCSGTYNLPNGINIGADNIVLDCSGATLNATLSRPNDTSPGSGIILSGRTGVTVKNCNVQGYEYGIHLHSSSNNILTGNNASSNWYGIFLLASSSNILTGNNASSNHWNGIYLHSSSSNTLRNNTANSNYHEGFSLYYSSGNTLIDNTASSSLMGILLQGSSSNTLTGNTACSNTQSDFNITNPSGNFGDDNTCDTTYGWNDDETTGCTYACGELPQPLACVIELQKDGIKKEEIEVGELFNIVFTDYSGNIEKVRFLNDELQNELVDEGFGWTDPPFSWTESDTWWIWNWDASDKVMQWSFSTPGIKEVWAEVKDSDGQTSKCSANISAIPCETEEPSELWVEVQNDKGLIIGNLDSLSKRYIVNVLELYFLDKAELESEDVILIENFQKEYIVIYNGKKVCIETQDGCGSFGPLTKARLFELINAIKFVPNSWVLKVNNMHQNQRIFGNYIWWEIEDITDGITGWVIAKEVDSNKEYLKYDLAEQENWESKTKELININERKNVIVEIIKNRNKYFNNLDEIPSELLLAIAAQEMPSDANNFHISFDCGRGIGQITTNSIVGEHGGVKCFCGTGKSYMPFEYDSKWSTVPSDYWQGRKCIIKSHDGIQTYRECLGKEGEEEWYLGGKGTTGRCMYYKKNDCGCRSYTNTYQGILANIKDKLGTIADDYEKSKNINIGSEDNFEFRNNLEKGDRGKDVVYLHYILKSELSLDDSLLPITGYYGSLTDNAIKTFQSENSIIEESVGVKTREKLNILLKNKYNNLYKIVEKSKILTGTTWRYNHGEPKELITTDIYDYLPAVSSRLKNLNVIFPNYETLIEDDIKDNTKAVLMATMNNYISFEIKSPVELRILDSNGNLTGLINHVVKNNIENSLYDEEREAVLILYPNDVYYQEIIGTDNGTYGLEITSAEDGNTTTFTLTNVPTTNQTTHQYTINWEDFNKNNTLPVTKLTYKNSTLTEVTYLGNDEVNITGEPIIWNLSITNSTSSYTPFNIIFTYNDTIVSRHASEGTMQKEFIGALPYDILLSSIDDTLKISLNSINLIQTNNKTIGLEKTKNQTEIIYAVNLDVSEWNQTNVTINLSYDEFSIDHITLYKCNNWNFTEINCTDENWTEIVYDEINGFLSFDVSSFSGFKIEQEPYCGDGFVSADEECDGSDLGNLTCSSYGYNTGSLSCSPECNIILSSCYNIYTLTIDLYKIPDSTGLNLISLPLSHSFTTAEDLCQNITHSNTITKWDALTQQYLDHSCGTPFNNFTLADRDGYFISVTQNTTWTLTGEKLTLPPIDLIKPPNKTGLNLIGLPYSSTITPLTAEGLCQNITHSDTITKWNPITQQYIGHPCTTPFNNFILNNGEGYFVSVTQNTTWMPN